MERIIIMKVYSMKMDEEKIMENIYYLMRSINIL